MTRSTRPRTTTAHIPLAVGEPAGAATRGAIIIAYAHCIEQGLLTKTGPAHQKAAVESVHFLLWTYNPTTGKVKLDSADKSNTVSFAYPPLVGGSRSARTHPKRKRGRANAVSKELGENRADPCGRLRRRFAIYPPEQAPSAHLKQLVKKIGQDKAMEMLKGAEQGFKDNYALLKKLSEM